MTRRVLQGQVLHDGRSECTSLHGRWHCGANPNDSDCWVIDLDELFKHGDETRAFRLIDTRTITELIVDNELFYV
jgi:hypothetical protein